MTPTADPKRLQPNPWNTNHVSPEAAAKLDASVRRRGMFKPVIVRELADGTLQIIGGQHRVEAAVRLKLKTVPIHNVGRIDDKAAQEIGLLDNARYGEDDTLKLAELLEGLGTPEELASFMPLDDDDLAGIFAATNIALEDLDLDDDGPHAPPPARPKVQTHQIMRFKVPVEDVAAISQRIERVMKEQKFTDEDSLANAGNALVHVFKESQP
jgi:ParB-like chromosome segregation protein Spo0J